jgi:hypothetical protein
MNNPEIFTVSCRTCRSFTAGYVLHDTDEVMADIGRAAVYAARMGLRIGVTRQTVTLGGCNCVRQPAPAVSAKESE